MEVGQIGRGLVHHLLAMYSGEDQIVGNLPPLELIEAVAFSHDLGHPPFGHGGETALNYMMREHGGFEGNGQALRLLSRLEPHREGFGLDLTRRTLLGILKYPVAYERLCRTGADPNPTNHRLVNRDAWKPPKCYLGTEVEIVDWLLDPLSKEDRERFMELRKPPTQDEHGSTKYKALDTSMMELADDIAYGVHDLEDGIVLGLIARDHLEKVKDALDPTWATSCELPTFETLADQLFWNPMVDEAEMDQSRKMAVGGIVNALVTSASVAPSGGFREPLLSLNVVLADPAKRFLQALKELTNVHIIQLQAVQSLEYRGRMMVMDLFEGLSSDPRRLLTPDFVVPYESAPDAASRSRVVCDYVAGMTDSYAIRMYNRLFTPGHGNVFERL